MHFLSFNQKDDALTDPAIWEAARYLVNYEGMTDSFLKGQMEIHQAFWPKGFPGSLRRDALQLRSGEGASRSWPMPGVETADQR